MDGGRAVGGGQKPNFKLLTQESLDYYFNFVNTKEPLENFTNSFNYGLAKEKGNGCQLLMGVSKLCPFFVQF